MQRKGQSKAFCAIFVVGACTLLIYHILNIFNENEMIQPKTFEQENTAYVVCVSLLHCVHSPADMQMTFEVFISEMTIVSLVCLLRFYVLATSMVISGQAHTCDSAHSC